jgi:outer membrane receptor protein involved in Fe transport
MKKFTLALAILVGIGFGFSSVLAQEKEQDLSITDLLELSLEELLNVSVLSASKVLQKQSEAPNIISTVSKELRNSYDWLSINEVLSYHPGYFISNDYERRTLGFRGMFEGWNNNHILMMVDGIPFNDNLYGTAYTWDITPLNFTNSMEVIFGPGGALYGSNAMNGVITLNTLNANDLNGIGTAKLRLGTQNYRHFDMVTGAENDNYGMVLSISHTGTDGNEYMTYDASERTNNDGLPAIFKTNDSRESSYLFAKLYGKNKFKGLMFQYHEQHWDFQTGHGWLFVVPDRPENMREYRRIFALKYSNDDVKNNFGYEFTSRFQTHGVDWNMRFFNDGGLEGYYPDGVSEYLNTSARDLFVRAQGRYSSNNHILILGIENTTFLYSGDKAHYANIEMNTWADPTTQTYYELNPWLEFVHNKPIYNVAGYAQYITPKLFDKLQLTISGRFDRMFFDYTDLESAGSPVLSKSFQMFTPRIAAVFSATKSISVKAIFGQAFRTPTPTEMFGYNTYTLASNINELEPEVVTNFDLGVIWDASSFLNFRINGFWVNFENQIAYSVANANLSTNIYSLSTAGIELVGQYATRSFAGFANLTLSKRLNEVIEDETISVNKDKITWAPSTMIKFGGRYNLNRFSFSALGNYQGKMERRESDKVDGMSDYRPQDYVKGWFTADCKVSYSISQNTQISLVAKNALNQERYFIKNNAYLFDYKLEGRQVIGEVTLRF